MLSYLHGFHAGNHADVLKHSVLVALLDHLLAKPRPIAYVDTHAGAGRYDLGAAEAQKRREFDTGIGRLRGRDDLPAAVARYVEVVAACCDADSYPGSPLIALQLLRPEDSLDCYELHPREQAALGALLGDRPGARVHAEDGFRGLVAQMPPPSRRGLVLMDPPYEIKDDYGRVVDALTRAHRRFATGTYALWYPVVERRRVETLVAGMAASGMRDLHRFELCVAPDTDGRGMTGSGMLVVNPAWTLPAAMREALPWLADRLGGPGASWSVELLVEE